MAGKDYDYRRNLANTVLLVVISLVILPVLYRKFWQPALLQDVIQSNRDTVPEVYFPSLTVLQRADWTSEATLTLSNLPKCGLHWLPPPNHTLPSCRDVPSPGTEGCDCAANWDTAITESLVWQNTTYRALTLHATDDMLCVVPTTKMVVQAYFTYDATRAASDAGRVLHPSVYLAVFDPTLTLTQALEAGYTRLRLVNGNGVTAVTLGLVMRQAAADATPAYDYDVDLSGDPARDVPDGGEVGWITVHVEFPSFERRVDVVRRAMEWSDMVATAGAWFSLFQIVSWILSGAALQSELMYTGPFRAQTGLRTGLRRRMDHAAGYIALPQPTAGFDRLPVHLASLDAAIQSALLAYSYPGDTRLQGTRLPTRIDSIRINVPLCEATQLAKTPFRSWASSKLGDAPGDINGDIDVYDNDGGLGPDDAPPTPFDISSATLQEDASLFNDLERVSYIYLRRLGLAFLAGDRGGLPAYQLRLLEYIDHLNTTQAVTKAQSVARAAWEHDTHDQILNIIARRPGRVDMDLIHTVAGRLDRLYIKALGLSRHFDELARIASQISHRHPHMRVLEVGAGTGGATKLLPLPLFCYLAWLTLLPEAYTTNLGSVLQVPSDCDLISSALNDLGTDSLVVVSIRSWATKALRTEVTVLKALDSSTAGALFQVIKERVLASLAKK
ncbi:hypothetical protein C8A05DRAFT_32193 [Staphylotrichum tortipilum]|uniref:Uncharacterized protein n=1 Tax=Staphylotrichum tortipilum TaxID=2831512 RepID=A0AAN6RV22_9PEZI|nr:hypothetical protein C8A05DRAFT_32193 [Staphylotrichum longicolle]